MASLGPDIAKKVIVDVTNPLTPFPDLEVLWNGNTSGEGSVGAAVALLTLSDSRTGWLVVACTVLHSANV